MKQIFLLLITMTLLFVVQTTKAQFAGGDGSQGAPYQIASRAHLEALQNFNGEAGRGKYFVLTADIDLSGEEWTSISTLHNNSQATVPNPDGIVQLDTAFHGKLDGANHKILHLNTPKSSKFYLIGLFGQLGDGAAISNLHVEGIETDTVFVQGKTYARVGAIAGRIFLMSDATEGVSVTNCSNNIRVYDSFVTSNTGHAVGGLVGEIVNASMSVDVIISKSSNTGEVTGGYHAGGLVGRVEGYAAISDCYVNANLKNLPTMNGGTYSGGIVGTMGTEGILTRCYAAGTITNTRENTSSHTSGGIMGLPNNDSPGVEISKCVALQDFIAYRVDGTGTSSARATFRIQGHATRTTTKSNNYAAAELVMKDVETVVPVTGETVALDGKDGADVALATAKTQAFYTGLGWDFTNTWTIAEGASFPTLKSGATSVKYPKQEVNTLKASASNGVLTVKGLVPGEKINVYTALGQVISSKTATSRETTLNLPTPGIYLVSSANRTIKVIGK